jgi:hypothetical protein
MSWVSDAEFKRRHAAATSGPLWKEFRQRALAYYKYRCAVCGFDYVRRGFGKYQLQVDHRTYRDKKGDFVFGKESLAQVRLLCPDHHGKGISSDAAIGEYRKSFRWLKAILWLSALPWKVLKFALRR